jgi:hypothetical protein
MIRRYSASADNTIVNAFEPNLVTRATGANCGLADVLEVYSIYGRQYTGSQELSLQDYCLLAVVLTIICVFITLPHLKQFLKISF